MAGSTRWVLIALCLLVLLVLSAYMVAPDLHGISNTDGRDDGSSQSFLSVQQQQQQQLRTRDDAPSNKGGKHQSTANVMAATPSNTAGEQSPDKIDIPTKCVNSQVDGAYPVLYNLKTALGVTYDGGHWFHVAENFMAQHSKLRANGGNTDATDIYFNFDKPGFSLELNGITRLMVAIAAMKEHKHLPSRLNLHFLHIPIDYVNPEKLSESVSNSGNKASFKQVVVQLPPEAKLPDHRIVTLTKNMESKARFVPHAVTAAQGASYDRTCVLYKGSYGGEWPTPQRGHWFEGEGDAYSFRQKLRTLCPRDTPLLQKYNKVDSNSKNGRKMRKMVVYQRDLSRKLADEDDALKLLRESFPPAEWDISVLLHTPDASPCYLAHLLHDVDVLLTPHGFQSMLLLFLPQPSLIFEVFPYRYYKRGYGPLAKDYGLLHAGVMSPPLTWHRKFLLGLVTTDWCMLSKQCRNYARGDNVKLTTRGVDSLVRAVKETLDPALHQKYSGVRDSLYN